MGFMDKVKDFVAPIEEEDDYQEAPQAEKGRRSRTSKSL